MVQPLGRSNAYSSYSAQKSYKNHTTAFEGQWRIPRPAPKLPEVRTKLTYNTYYSSTEGLVTKPLWQQMLETLLPIPTLFGRNEVEPVIEQPEVPETPEVEKPEEPKPDNAPVVVAPPKKENPFAAEIEYDKITTTETEETPGEELTVETKVAKGIKNPDNSVDYWGWNTIANAYGAPNTPEFRKKFRKEVLGGKDIWQVGTQHFPKEFEVGGVKYQFNKDTFEAKPLDKHTPQSGQGNGPSVGNTEAKKTDPTQTEKTTVTYSASFRGTIDGKTYTASTTGATSKDDAKTALKKDLRAQGLQNTDDAVSRATVKKDVVE